jgi:hypothetical protein
LYDCFVVDPRVTIALVVIGFRHYSTAMRPEAEDLVRYLRDFQQRFNFTVKFNTTIRNVRSPRPKLKNLFETLMPADKDAEAAARKKKLKKPKRVHVDPGLAKMRKKWEEAMERQRIWEETGVMESEEGTWEKLENGDVRFNNKEGGAMIIHKDDGEAEKRAALLTLQ